MARPIDANELVEFPHSESAGTDEQIENWIEECGLSDEEVIDRAKKLCWAVIEGFINVVKTAPTLTLPDEWVSVEDELPSRDGVYIVHTKQGSVTTAHFYADKKFRDDYIRTGHWQSNRRVTHWMPLPALPDCRPPEGEED